jgi:hypothetical protein
MRESAQIREGFVQRRDFLALTAASANVNGRH